VKGEKVHGFNHKVWYIFHVSYPTRWAIAVAWLQQFFLNRPSNPLDTKPMDHVLQEGQ
jgi:hypothetical protein